MLSEVLEAARSILLGKSSPGAEGDPLVLGLWVIASGFFAMAVAFARRESKGGATAGCALIATVMAGGLIVRGLMPEHHRKAPTAVEKTQPNTGTSGTSGGGAHPAANDTFSMLAGIALGGSTIATIGNTASAKSCEQSCRSHDGCVAYTFDQPTGACQLKRQVGNQLEFKGSTSGIKRKDQ